MPDIPTTEPLSFREGDKVQWQKSIDKYPASESYVLKYYLVKSGTNLITIEAAASGDDHLVTITAADSTNYAAGRYSYQARIEKGDEKTTVSPDGAVIEILPNLSADATGADYRSFAKKMVDALQALEANMATKEQLSYSIGGRSLSYLSPEERYRWLQHYTAIYLREERKAGRGRSQKIKVQFP